MAAHSIVLRPNTDATSCSLSLAYHKPVPAEQPALLVVEVANPRILALLRYEHISQHVELEHTDPSHHQRVIFSCKRSSSYAGFHRVEHYSALCKLIWG